MVLLLSLGEFMQENSNTRTAQLSYQQQVIIMNSSKQHLSWGGLLFVRHLTFFTDPLCAQAHMIYGGWAFSLHHIMGWLLTFITKCRETRLNKTKTDSNNKNSPDFFTFFNFELVVITVFQSYTTGDL